VQDLGAGVLEDQATAPQLGERRDREPHAREVALAESHPDHLAQSKSLWDPDLPREARPMQLHPSLSRQLTLTRERDARAAADCARLVRAARCAPPRTNDVRRRPAPQRGCEDPVLA
jgi:hypothetical protein